ncbi:putative RNA 2'-phosphotransferase [Dokdonia pacifica]|uniref:Probable RNA 2'-phosphotransferase n=1 Tax=Dokdonia pacifica TaxID=1627892 RepID=A0A238YJP8_9FLAO|nr:RNA 2'-phosphotransferase [Dokdonia pacifica]GGG12096.1 putative RNA 2'-phosphotransferase [Dokdonia pacifica]SNR70941.1 putative RNA 2'-phosphotransferase [Dokdonia pacifica]
MNTKHISKFLSLVLRHNPDKLGITLDTQGWTDVNILLQKMNAQGKNVDVERLKEVVATNDKKRFAFNEDQTMIRANQGHSISVDLNYEAITPPNFLYHGTVPKFMGEIKQQGLRKMSRHHVHLSEDKTTAMRVGARRGVPTILVIRSSEMHQKGHLFYKSENNVWLTDHVPSEFIDFK